MRFVVPSLLAVAVGVAAEDPVTTIPGFTADGTVATAPGGPVWGGFAAAPSEIIVVGDRRPMEVARTTATVAIVDGEDRRTQGYPTTTTDLLRGVPAVDAGFGGGFLGSAGGLRLRGTGTGDTRLLLDGIPLSDAGEISGQKSFGGLASSGIDRIEIAKGPQSGLYGSAAIGGAIDLVTRRPTKRAESGVRLEGGSFGTADGEVWSTGPVSRAVGYAISLGGLRTDGFSSKADGPGRSGGSEADGADQGQGTARVEYRPSDAVLVYGAVRGEALNEELDAGGPDDTQSWGRTRLLRGSAGASLDLGLAEVGADAARTRSQRDYSRTYSFGTYDSSYVAVEDFLGVHATGEILTPGRSRSGFDRAVVTAGLDVNRAHGEFQETSDVTGDTVLRGLWGQVLLGGKAWEFSQTARQDWHSREGGAGTWRSGLALYPWGEEVKFHGSAGTAFRAPSIYQLEAPPSFGSPVGNEDLTAVRSRGFDLGHVTRIPGDVTLEQTLFRTVYTQDIGFDDVNGYQNTGGYTVEGLENAVALRDGLPGLRLRLTYTAQRSNLEEAEIAAGRGFTYLPRQKASIQPSFHADRWWVAARLDATGRSIASQYDAHAEVAGSAVLGASAGYVPARGWEVYARGENLTSAAYERVPDYGTSPLAAYGGVTATF